MIKRTDHKKGRKATWCVLFLSFALVFGFLPQAFAEFSPPEGTSQVLGVGRIQSSTEISTPTTTQEKFSAGDNLSATGASKVEQLATPLSRENQVAAIDAMSKNPLYFEPAVGDIGPGGWMVGLASSYGLNDEGVNEWTANGDKMTEVSLGVAVDHSMTYLFGRRVEIEYNGARVVAVINDCGPILSFGRVLDLQPGVCRALGVDPDDGWGVRTVRWRLID